MSYFKKLSDLADRLEHKYGQEINQSGTTELFFGDAERQQKFSTAIQDTNGFVYQLLLDAFNKGNGNTLVSFDLKINADPGIHASWRAEVQPPTIKIAIKNALDKVYQNLMGKSMDTAQQIANDKAKAGSGSGTNNVGALELAP